MDVLMADAWINEAGPLGLNAPLIRISVEVDAFEKFDLA
jgi:hypothetical protein